MKWKYRHVDIPKFMAHRVGKCLYCTTKFKFKKESLLTARDLDSGDINKHREYQQLHGDGVRKSTGSPNNQSPQLGLGRLLQCTSYILSICRVHQSETATTW